MKAIKKETTFSEMKNYLEDDNTIILNKDIKSRREAIKSRESINARKTANKLNKKSELWNNIQNLFIWAIIVLIMCFIWLHGIQETNAYESNNIVKTSIKRNNRTYSVQVWRDRVSTMRSLGYSPTRILDLLAILNMECWSYKWDCFNGNDVWSFQINKIHKEQYNKSWEFYNNQDWGGLFTYQLKYANRLLDSYEANNCKPEYVSKYGIGDTYNQKRWRCIAFHYNGHPQYKYAYNKLWWKRREIISNIIFKKG